MIKIKPFKYWHISLLLLSSAAMLTGCGSEEKNAAGSVQGGPPAVEVETITVSTQPLDITTRLSGRTSAYRVAEVRPQVEGIVLKRLFVEGSTVESGQVLYQIDPVRYEATLANAEAELAKAQANLVSARLQAERYRGLVDRKMVSQQANDDAEASFRQAEAVVKAAQASVRSAKINLDYTQVKAPISGQIGRSTVTEGALVTANQTSAMATIKQLDPLYVDLSQSSTDLLRLRRQAGENSKQLSGIKVILDDGTVVEQPATMQFADVSVSEDTGTVTVRALLPNTNQFLMPGLYVRAEVPVEHREEAILVPQVAVTRDPTGGAQVMLVNAESKVEVRPIVVSQIIGTSWLVDSGLKAGDQVIVSGLQKIQPGASVVIAKPAQALQE
ncbi:efflux RND transporter periplasmic adaptor subunit [Gynuella sunshinyii]|uniref:Membrane-fusion protein n=1 Tax=Gynuella sunshinyii YC6258 TaxID=1445510 RepID=A0A0C5VJ48_9GAMM|nr:efflux RND transporter periplasmic adaptor subunit [Gynuella sunshinyii]AJQ93423.1 membrane-fusion protein [Gynuella sunshinyii YC6258]